MRCEYCIFDQGLGKLCALVNNVPQVALEFTGIASLCPSKGVDNRCELAALARKSLAQGKVTLSEDEIGQAFTVYRARQTGRS